MNTALVTGASVGIGREIAAQLADRGFDLIISARRANALEEVADDIRRNTSRSVVVVPADLSLDSDVSRLVAAALDASALSVLVNNAGSGYYGGFFDGDATVYDSMIGLNCAALTRLCRAIIPRMVNTGVGRVMNVASVAAFQPGPLMAVYYATKAYVLSFSQALSRELLGTGVTVTALCPGPTRSEFHMRAGIPGPDEHAGAAAAGSGAPTAGQSGDEAALGKTGAGAPGNGSAPRSARRGNAMAHKHMPDSRTVASYGIRAMMRGKRVAVHGLLYKVSIFAERFLPRRFVVNSVYRLQSSRPES